MTSNKETANSPSIETSFLEVFDHFIEELHGLAARAKDHQTYYEFLLDRIKTLTAAKSTSIWFQADQTWHCIKSKGIGLQSISARQIAQRLSKPTQFEVDHQGLIVGSIETPEHHRLAVVLKLSSETPDQLRRVYNDLLNAVCDISNDFHRNQSLNSQDQRFAKLESFIQLLCNSHSSLDAQAVGHHLANDSRYFLNADRVWLFRSSDAGLLSCSGVAHVNPRSRSLIRLQKIARMAMRDQRPIVWHQDDEATTDSMSDYGRTNSLNAFYVSPMIQSEQTVAVIVVEMFREHDQIAMASGLNQLTNVAAPALNNAIQYSQVPFRRTLTLFNWLLRRFQLQNLFSTLLTAAVLLALVLSLFLIKIDFYIPVHGQMRPVNERNVFAPSHGVVVSMRVQYGDQVSESDVLLQMESPEYQLKLQQLQGELDVARKQLEANQVLRSRANQDSRDEFAVRQLTAEIEQNRLKVSAINERIKQFLKLVEQLKLVACIDGKIVTRDLAKTLLNRPVLAGNKLLTIAETDADWHLELDIPDREMGYLNEYDSKHAATWELDYYLESELDQRYSATIHRIESNNTFDSDGNSVVKAYAVVDKSEFEKLRVGQAVKGRVFCGRKSLFFVWTRDVRDFVRSNFFWF